MTSCPSCGAPVEPAARFCLECGFALESEAKAAADPWQGRMVAGRFKLLSKLGDGGMGEVYRAEQLPMGRHVALKILRHALSDDARQVERFKREAQAASSLTHPNTIIVHDFGQDTDGTLFLAMEYLAGEPLSGLMAREGPLAGERAARILAQVSGSLEEAHRRGMVHRDLKPENIFLIERAGTPDYVKVLDFGIAKVTESGGQKLSTITQAGAIFGTPQYMAPEQIRGEGIDARADIYALGVVLYEMISGHLPFAAGSVVEMLTKHLTASPAPINRKASVPDPVVARLEAVALRALSKNPESRQQSAREFLEDLMVAVPQLSLTSPTGLLPATPVATPAWSEAPTTRGGSTRVVAITALLAAVAAGAWFWFQGFGPGAGGGGVPVVVKQGAPDGAQGGAPATEAAPASEAAAPATAAPATEAAAPATEAVTPEQAAQAAAAEQAAEEEAKKAEAEAAAAEADANKPMTDEEAARIAAEAEAQAAQAGAEAEKAAAEMKAKAEAEKAAAAEAKQKDAEAAKANSDAEKTAAQQAAADAKVKKEEAEAAAAAAKAEAAAANAKTEEEKKAAAEALAKAQAELAAAQQATAAAAQAANAAAAEANRLKAEADALRAALAKIEEEKAAAAAAEAEAKARQEEAKERAKAAKAKKRVVGNSKVFIKSKTLGVRITVDGKSRGVTPLRGSLNLKPGSHTIVGTKGAKKVSKKITVKGGKVERFQLDI